MIYSSKQLLQALHKSYRNSRSMYNRLVTISDEYLYAPNKIIRFISKNYTKLYSLSADKNRFDMVTLNPRYVVSQLLSNNCCYAVRVGGIRKCAVASSFLAKLISPPCRHCPGLVKLPDMYHCVGYGIYVKNKYIAIVNIFTEQEIENLKKKYNIQIDYIDY